MTLVVAPLFVSRPILEGNTPALLLVAHHALTSGSRVVGLHRRSLGAVAEGMGFRRLNAPNASLDPVPGAYVICSPGSVTLAQGGSSMQLAGIEEPPPAWNAATTSAGEIAVYLVRPHWWDFGRLASMAKRRRAWGGLVTTISPDQETIRRRYTFLGYNGPEAPAPQVQSAILDSSALVDLERAAMGTGSRARWTETQQLAMQLAPMDVIPGSALLELVSARDATHYNHRRAQSLIAAVNAWFDGGVERTRSLQEVRDAYTAELTTVRSLPTDIQPHWEQLIYYASLLKLAHSWQRARGRFQARQRRDLYVDYVRWLTEDLEMMAVTPLQVARDRLIGPQSEPAAYTDQLLKPGRRSLAGLWGASWDLTHLGAIDLVESGSVLEIGGRRAVLVTADRGLVALRNRIHSLPAHAEIGGVRLRLKLSRFDLDARLEHYRGELEELSRWSMHAVTVRRETNRQPPTLERIEAIIQNLEDELNDALTRGPGDP